MLNITLVDDNEDLLSIIRSLIEQHLIDSYKISDYSAPRSVIYDLNQKRYSNIYFLDIEMPAYNGFDLAKQIRKSNKDAFIVFLTSHPEYALQGYDLEIQADYYILKSQMEQKIPLFLDDVKKKIQNKRYYIIQNTIRFIKLDLDDVYTIHKASKNSIITTKDDRFEERISLEKLLEHMNFPDLIVADRGTIVNLQHIKTINNNLITLDNGEEVIIGRHRIKKVKAAINEYWGNRLCR